VRHPRSLFLLVFALLALAAHVQAATEIPFSYSDGLIWVKLKAAGQDAPLNFLLDSGAGASVLDLRTARRIGAKLGGSESVQGVDGRAIAYRVLDFDSTIGTIAAPRSLLALDLSGVSAGVSQRIDGLLGADFFRNRIVQIDFAAKKIRLLTRGELKERGCELLPISSRNGAMCVRVGVAGQPCEWMRVDTGCSSALRWVVTAAKANKFAGTSLGIAARSAREVETDVQLGQSRFTGVKTGIHTRQIFVGEAGLLGNGLLSKFTVTIDGTKDRLVLAKR
jgi:predicted aspartyl protease